VAHCSDAACFARTSSSVDGGGEIASIAIGSDGFGLMAFGSGSILRVNHCADVPCTSVVGRVLDDQLSGTGSMTIGADGLGLIAYATLAGRVRVAHCSDVPCTAAILSDLETAAWPPASATIGADELPLIVMKSGPHPADGQLVVHCSNAFCTPYARPR
jgi:hypothetical protein